MTHYNLQCLDNPASVFASRFVLPLWNYIVPPPKPQDKPYIGQYNFAAYPLSYFLLANTLEVGDVLELFWLRRRVKFIGAQIRIDNPANGLILQPVTNSGLVFDAIDASSGSQQTYLVKGGIFDRTTNIAEHSVVIDDPDYFGLKLLGDITNIVGLNFFITLDITEQFSAYDVTNSVKKDG